MTTQPKVTGDEGTSRPAQIAMRFAYADPPYLGCGLKRYGALHEDAADFDRLDAHAEMIARLVADYPNGWALSCHTPSLRAMLDLCPDDVRIGAWVKPFASFKANVNPAYAWEPVIWRGGRKGDRNRATVRDWLAENITMERGFPGAKPRAFGLWVCDLLGVEPGDTVDDLFAGSGAARAAFDERLRLQPEPIGMFTQDSSS